MKQFVWEGRWPAALRSAMLMTLVLCGGLVGCESEEQTAADEAAIFALVEAYRPKLAEAYATGNTSSLTGLAADKEKARLAKVIRDLELEGGRVLEPTPLGFEVEEITVWNYSNAYVTTIETWDFRIIIPGSGRLLSEVKGQKNRVRYQLKRTDPGTWVILDRFLEATFEE